MNGPEHLKFGLYSVMLIQAGLSLEIDLNYEQYALVGLGVAIGSYLPDIDHPKTKLARYVPIIVWLHKLLKKVNIHWFRHGGFTHTLVVNAGIFYLAYALESLPVAGIGFGYFTHLIADHITGNKLPMLYWPIGRRKRK